MLKKTQIYCNHKNTYLILVKRHLRRFCRDCGIRRPLKEEIHIAKTSD